MTTRLTFLGGLGEIGRNCAAIEIDSRIALIDMGLMFPEEDMLGVDLVFPDWRWMIPRRQDVELVVLTHGHEDHIGALGYFLREFPVPVYGTRLTVELAKSRVEELGVDATFRPVRPGRWLDHGPFRFMFLRVAHSVPDATAVAFDTPDGIVLHSGDFKLDPTPVDGRPTDLLGIARLADRGVRLLLSDSTNAEREGFVPSETSLAQPILDIVRNAPGRVIAACFSSHLHRVQQIVDAGIEAGRKIAFFGRSMHRNTEVGRSLGVLRVPDGVLVDIAELIEEDPARQLLVTTGSQGEPFSALSLMAQGRHRFVTLEEGDTILISATPIPGNETAVSRVVDNLIRQGAVVYHGKNAPVHVSGHAARAELATFLSLVKPSAFVPVHGEYRHLSAHAQLARALGVPWVEVCEDGDQVVLDGDETRVERSAVEAGYVFLDGLGVGDVAQGVLRDRGHLADEGVVVVTVGISRQTGSIIYGPDLDSHGLMADPEPVLTKAADAVRRAVEEQVGVGRSDHATLQQTVRRATAQVIRAETARKPVILPVVVEL
jgi:ribonuclease J